MIDRDIWNDPKFAEDMADFRTAVRRYWKSNVKKYFSKREDQYGLPVKLQHRFLFAPFGDSNEPRLRNALEVRWTPESGHIMVNVLPIMVKSSNYERSVNIAEGTRYGKNVPFHEKRKYEPVVSNRWTYGVDLIELLKEGTRPSDMRYVYRIDARMPGGTRKGTSGAMWERWFSEFLVAVELELERLADKLEEKVAESISGRLTPVGEF